MRNLSEIVREARKTAKKNSREASELLGVGIGTLSNYEFNRLNIPVGVLSRMEYHYNLPEDILVKIKCLEEEVESWKAEIIARGNIAEGGSRE